MIVRKLVFPSCHTPWLIFPYRCSFSSKPTSKEFEQLLNVTATVSTVLQYLAGSSMCVGFIRKRTTGEASCLPFVAGAVNCAAWFKYGVLIGQPAMQVVNLIGKKAYYAFVIQFHSN